MPIMTQHCSPGYGVLNMIIAVSSFLQLFERIKNPIGAGIDGDW